uniref:DNA replication complex GINS protein SLD5 n=2 Tax=Lygus hesperus TaxID=30085 RepID=A0A0A9ZGT3_LYGHE
MMKIPAILLLLGFVVYIECAWIDDAPKLYSSLKRIVETVSDNLSGKEDGLFRKEFEDFKVRHHRQYKTAHEAKRRYVIWLLNYVMQLLGDPTSSEKINDEQFDWFNKETNEKIYKAFGKRFLKLAQQKLE